MTAANDVALAPPVLRQTACPICGTDEHDRELYPMNFDPSALGAAIFSARRRPDRLHYRMVRCTRCGLVRSNPVLETRELERLYRQSAFTYHAEAKYAGQTYAAQLARALPRAARRDRLLEIGCGSGFFLREARRHGVVEAWGVEPSDDAVAHAAPEDRPFIRQGLYERSTFPDEYFDVVCAFQVFDHLPDPAGALAACHAHLRPGGIALFVNHDIGAPLHRLLGEASPIVDVEHTCLYDRATMRLIFERAGFEVLDVFGVSNRYPLSYWAKLAPLPGKVKDVVSSVLAVSRLGTIPLTVAAGNLGLIARRPA